MNAVSPATTVSPVGDEPLPADQARAAIAAARDQLDEALRVLNEDDDPSAALSTVNECSEYIGRALWFLRLARGTTDREARSAVAPE